MPPPTTTAPTRRVTATSGGAPDFVAGQPLRSRWPRSASAPIQPPSWRGASSRVHAASGYAVVQTTSPLIARKSFWTVATTIEAAGLATAPYHAHVPSFGEWGFIVASHRPLRRAQALPPALRFLTVAGLPALFDFPPDMARVPTEVNRLSNQVLVQTFEDEWGKVQR